MKNDIKQIATRSEPLNTAKDPSEPAPPMASDEELTAMTDQELRAHLRACGHDPEEQLANFSASIGMMRCQAMLEPADEEAVADPTPASDASPFLIDFHQARFVDARVSAGRGLGAQENDPSRPVDSADLFGRQNWRQATFVRVRGNSMAPSGIHDGDSILVLRGIEARDGDIVVAYAPEHGEVVKRLRIGDDGPWLESSDPAYPPIRPANPGELKIEGIVKGRAGPLP